MKRNKVKSTIAALTVTVILSACGQNSEPTNSSDATVSPKETYTASVASTATPTEEPPREETLYERVGGKLYVGDEFTLGTYEQDNDLSNGAEDIEWIVLEKVKDNQYLCISKYVLDAQIFGKDGLEIRNRWSTSQLREWLNKDFYNTAFTDSDADNLVKMSTKYATWQSTKDTAIYWDTAEDMVRVLNYGELDSFPGCVKVTEYAKAQGAPYIDDGTREHENCANGWYMMSYDVNDAREALARHAEFSNPYDISCGSCLTVAMYGHVESFNRWSDTYRAYESDSAYIDKEGVRPVITVKLTNK